MVLVAPKEAREEKEAGQHGVHGRVFAKTRRAPHLRGLVHQRPCLGSSRGRVRLLVDLNRILENNEERFRTGGVGYNRSKYILIQGIKLDRSTEDEGCGVSVLGGQCSHQEDYGSREPYSWHAAPPSPSSSMAAELTALARGHRQGVTGPEKHREGH
ncbi:hypothetical protein VTO42DRAFT_2400 [Malbranchea cinnamomea]